MTDIVERLKKYQGPWLAPMEAAAEIERLRARVAELETHIDFFDPVSKCARCGVEERQTSLIPEEGNEWECFACWERENARERAAHMKNDALPK